MEPQMKKQAFTPFDAADYLKNESDIAAYLAAASADEDPQVLVVAMGDVIRARNVTQIARDAGLTREGVYKAFSAGGNPSFATVVRVAKALDLKFAFQSRARAAKRFAAGSQTVRKSQSRQASPKSTRPVTKRAATALSRR